MNIIEFQIEGQCILANQLGSVRELKVELFKKCKELIYSQLDTSKQDQQIQDLAKEIDELCDVCSLFGRTSAVYENTMKEILPNY